MKSRLIYFYLILFICFQTGCEQHEKKLPDSPDKGKLWLSVEETFKPSIQEQIETYQWGHPEVEIIPAYKNYSDCKNDFINDTSVHMIITSDSLTESEIATLKKQNYVVEYSNIAYDAIAMIVNANAPDTAFDVGSIRDIMSGHINSSNKFIFDGAATSTLQYVNKIIMNGASFDTSKVGFINNTPDLIAYISKHEDAIGFIGYSWIGNLNDTDQGQYRKKIKLAYIKFDENENSLYIRPSQTTIMNGNYKMIRPLICYQKEKYEGLSTGFRNFMRSRSGQLVFNKTYLGTVEDFRVRDARMNLLPEHN